MNITKQAIILGITGLVLGFLVAPNIYGASWGGRMMGWNNWNNMMGRNSMMGSRTSDIDSHFIEQMIPHHEDAIKMAEIALQKAEHGEIKTLAQNIINSQKSENEKMKNWYKSWFGNDVPSWSGMGMMHGGGMHMGMMGNATDVTSLQSAKPFDKEFIEQMIPHHQMAIMMANMLLYSSNRDEMKELAQDIVASQTKEINDMRGWYDKWY